MAREMFGDVVKPSITVGSKQWYTLPLSILAHVAVIGVLIVIPLLAADVLPTPPISPATVATRSCETSRPVSGLISEGACTGAADGFTSMTGFGAAA